MVQLLPGTFQAVSQIGPAAAYSGGIDSATRALPAFTVRRAQPAQRGIGHRRIDVERRGSDPLPPVTSLIWRCSIRLRRLDLDPGFTGMIARIGSRHHQPAPGRLLVFRPLFCFTLPRGTAKLGICPLPPQTAGCRS